MADWDADDFEVKLPAKPSASDDKWEGEDEDDDVKDAWDAESEEENSEKKEEDGSTVKAVQRKKKKKLADIIAEKEEEKLKRQEEELELEALNTPEAKLAEKLRLQRLEESHSLQLAKEMLGVADDSASSGLNFNPSTKEEFEALSSSLLDKLRALESSEHFNVFGETLLTELCTSLNIPTLRKVKGSVEGMISAKLKEEKANKNKGKNAKSANKATIKMDTDRSMFSRGLDEGYDDMDDFM